MKKPIVLFAVMLIFASCKHQEKMSQTHVTGNNMEQNSGNGGGTVTTNPSPRQDSLQDNGTMRLVVSFISIGAGTDYKAKEQYDSLVVKHARKPKFEETHWGREGEVDYCFTLSEMSSAEQADFVNKTKELLGNNKLVIITENSPCLHKR